MIIWLASYPKSGNTYLRAFLSAYYYSKDGNFDFDQIANIKQFPDKEFFNHKIESALEASKQWMLAQKKIIQDKKIKFFKTHSCCARQLPGHEQRARQRIPPAGHPGRQDRGAGECGSRRHRRRGGGLQDPPGGWIHRPVDPQAG